MEQTEALRQQMGAHLEELATGRSLLIERLETAALNATPDEVLLSTMNYEARQLVLQATAPDYIQALLYAEQLRESGLFYTVHLLQAQEAADGVMFQIAAACQQNGARAPP